ncbi:MoaB/Mog domain-containing protein [Aspergillus spinulosporus]
MGVDVVFRGVLRDDPAAMEESIVRALDDGNDKIVTSDAASAGRCDIIPGLVKRIRGRTVFHKVAVKPGHPILFAVLPNRRKAGETGETAFFGLPGNTVAAAACLQFFALPYLSTLQRQSPEEPQAAVLRLSSGEAGPCNGAAGKVLTFRERPDIFRRAISTRSGQVVIIDDHAPARRGRCCRPTAGRICRTESLRCGRAVESISIRYNNAALSTGVLCDRCDLFVQHPGLLVFGRRVQVEQPVLVPWPDRLTSAFDNNRLWT